MVICAGIAIGYFVWGAWAFDERIRVDDTVGLPQDRIDLLVEHARGIGAYSDEIVEHLRWESRWMPWRGATLFIWITGNTNAVAVTAGFHGGPLYGGGRSFTATWNGTGWEFAEAHSWVS